MSRRAQEPGAAAVSGSHGVRSATSGGNPPVETGPHRSIVMRIRHLPCVSHRVTVGAPVGVLTRDPPVVVDERLQRLREVQHLGLTVDLHVLAAPVVGLRAQRDPMVSPCVAGLRPARIRRDDDPAGRIDAARHRRQLGPSVGSSSGQHASVTGAEQRDELRRGATRRAVAIFGPMPVSPLTIGMPAPGSWPCCRRRLRPVTRGTIGSVSAGPPQSAGRSGPVPASRSARIRSAHCADRPAGVMKSPRLWRRRIRTPSGPDRTRTLPGPAGLAASTGLSRLEPAVTHWPRRPLASSGSAGPDTRASLARLEPLRAAPHGDRSVVALPAPSLARTRCCPSPCGARGPGRTRASGLPIPRPRPPSRRAIAAAARRPSSCPRRRCPWPSPPTADRYRFRAGACPSPDGAPRRAISVATAPCTSRATTPPTVVLTPVSVGTRGS